MKIQMENSVSLARVDLEINSALDIENENENAFDKWGCFWIYTRLQKGS